MVKAVKEQVRPPRPEHQEIIHAVIKVAGEDARAVTLIDAARQPEGSTPEQAEMLGISVFESLLHTLERGYSEDGFENNAGNYRLVRLTATIPAEPTCPMWAGDGFELAPQWQAHREQVKTLVSDPETLRTAPVIREKSVGERSSAPSP